MLTVSAIITFGAVKPGCQKGFTLIELAIVMLVSGLFMIAAAQAYTVYKTKQQMEITKTSVTHVKDALTEFRSINDRYPCPADPALGKDDPEFGIEQIAGSVCKQTGAIRKVIGRDADNQGGGDDVFIGMIPIRTLMNMNDRESEIAFPDALDGHHNRLSYAVTGKLVVASSFSDFLGAIYIEDEFGETLVHPEGAAHIAIFSHGKNNRGAYSEEGRLVALCTSGVPTEPPPTVPLTNSDTQNCNEDAIFLSGLLRLDPFSYNDDYLTYSMTKASNPWNYVGSVEAGTPPVVMNQISNSNTGGYVGFGTKTPETDLHFSENLRAQSVMTDQICDAGGLNCMPVAALAEDIPDMNCPPNQAVVSISENKVQCAPVPFSTTASTCPPGQYMYGISNMGTIYCSP